MRFDYQPPITHGAPTRSKRLFSLCLAIIGIGCISYALVIHKASNPADTDIKRPRLLLTSNDKPVLSLDKKSSKPVDPIIQAAAQTTLKKENWQTVTIKSGDTLSTVFSKLNIPSSLLAEIVKDKGLKKIITKLYPGQKLDFKFSESHFKELKIKLSSTKTLFITNDDQTIDHYYEEQQPITRLSFVTAQITDSLYATAQTSGLNDKLIMQMADILGWDIDFSSDIRANDSFKILYEEEYLQDKPINSGKILAVEFMNKGKLHKAVRYKDSNNQESYYSPDGQSLQKAFIRNPVNFTRISSHFTTARRHPILHKIRSHKGVDYAAPQGTPVKATGDGKISFIGTKGGYGKSIEVSHGQKYSTFYAHLSRFNSKLKNGSYVKQGQVIGYVGKTGLATGPHLHYEFRINGVHHNPITVSLPRSTPIAKNEKHDFSLHANNMLDLLNSQSQLAHND